MSAGRSIFRTTSRSALAVILAASTAAGQSTTASTSPRFEASRCPETVRLPEGIDSRWLRCGRVTVPQDRAASSKSLVPITLPVAVFKSPTARERTPVIFLAGGPGEAAVEVTSAIFMATPLGQLLARERPIIAFNQRGFGNAASGTSPALGILSYRWRATREQSIQTLADSARKMAARLRARGIRPENFTTLHAVEDIVDVAKALGHDRVVLFATSYGTRVALQFMRRHPEMVEAAILDGVAPPAHVGLFDPQALADRRRGVAARVVEDCLQAPACRAEYGDLGTVAKAMERPESPPLHVVVNLPSDGGWVALDLSGRDVLSALGAYANTERTRPALPQLLDELGRGDTLRREMSPHVVLHVVYETALAKAAGPHYPLVYHVVLCGDDPSGVIQAGGRAVCDAMGVPFGGAEAVATVQSDAPTLLFSASYDAQTPPALAEEAARTLSRSHHVLFPGIGHLVYARPLSATCAAVIVHAFLLDGTQRPPDACATSLVPAFLPRSAQSDR